MSAPREPHDYANDPLTDWYWDIYESITLYRAGGPLLAETPEQMTDGAKRIYAELVTVRALLGAS
jgi:hypothetical protein